LSNISIACAANISLSRIGHPMEFKHPGAIRRSRIAGGEVSFA